MNQQTTDFSVPVPCNLCGADNAEERFAAGVAQIARIVECRKCGLMYASPRAQLVDHEDYEQWEPAGLLDGVATDTSHPYRWRFDKEQLQVRDFDPTRKTLAQLHPEPGHIVEIGSGLGFLLREYKDAGWQVTGVDPWREVASFTRDEHGIETIPTTLERAGLPDACADVVVMLHVIEHVPDPVATFREIHRILKPGGHLVVETPRYDTTMFRMMGKRERSLRQDGHIYFFTTDSLRQSYEKAGLTEVETRFVGRSLTAERFLWNLANITKSDAVQRSTSKLAWHLKLRKLRFTMNLRDMMRVIAEKPRS